jgi:hypothetical protein
MCMGVPVVIRIDCKTGMMVCNAALSRSGKKYWIHFGKQEPALRSTQKRQFQCASGFSDGLGIRMPGVVRPGPSQREAAAGTRPEMHPH